MVLNQTRQKLFNAIGLTEANFIIIDRPMLVEHLVVPAPAFTEQSEAYLGYGEFCANMSYAGDWVTTVC